MGWMRSCPILCASWCDKMRFDERARAGGERGVCLHDRSRDRFRYITSPSLCQIERHYAERALILPSDQIADDCVAVGVNGVRLHEGLTVLAEIAKHKMKVVIQ
jgi:hypothetical protein